jgi:hypothetical protein
MTELKQHLARVRAGKPTVDPLAYSQDVYLRKMKQIGLTVTPAGKIVSAGGGSGK